MKIDIDLLIFHDKCMDGICSAWATKQFNQINEIIGCKAGVSIDITKYYEKNIVFVDICPPHENITELAKYNKILVLDHHKSAKDSFDKNGIPDNVTFVFDINRSGCQIVWDYYSKNMKRPWFIDYVADRDLWTWKLENSKYINLALHHDDHLINFDSIDKLYSNKNIKIKNLVEKGKMIESIQNKQMEFEESRSVIAKIKIENKDYIVRLATCIPSLRSDLGNRLANKIIRDGDKSYYPDFSAVYSFDPKSEEWWISLRANNSSPDLSVLASCLGGGGHKNASGFTIKKPNTLTTVFEIIGARWQ